MKYTKSYIKPVLLRHQLHYLQDYFNHISVTGDENVIKYTQYSDILSKAIDVINYYQKHLR